MSLVVTLTRRELLPKEISTYDATVVVGDGTDEGSTLLYRGVIRHRRADGWQALLQLLVIQATRRR